MLVKPFERQVYALDQKINDRGIRVDLPFVYNAINFANRKSETLIEQARELTGLSNPNSVAQLKNWLEGNDVLVDSLNKKALAKLIGQTDDKRVEKVLRIRQQLGKSSVSKYTAMVRAVCSDSRVRGLVQYYGASRTGRWAGRIVQMQNLPQNKLKDLDLARQLVAAGEFELFDLMFDTFDTLSQLIRTAFVGVPEFTVADFSAIEARVVAWFCGVAWRMEVFATHGKIYEASASEMFRIPMSEFEEYEARGAKHPARQKGKVAELLLGYGGGVNALINGGALDMGLQEHDLQPLVDAWRAANPEVVAMWRALESAAKACIRTGKETRAGYITFKFARGCLLMVMPNRERALTYQQARINRDGQIEYLGTDPDTKRWGIATTWGGKLLENAAQAISRDVLAEAMLQADKQDIPIVLHVHDEIVADGDHLKPLLQITSR
ncbi:MAG TPA: DNA polymerase, partial [Limnobacter sp.]|nr:DNA polymerase [Limnobacter sp.]